MRNIFIFLTSLGLILFTSTSYSQSQYTHDDFTITFPSDPTETIQDVPIENVTYKMTTLTSLEENSVNIFSFIDYSPEYMDIYSSKEFLENVKGGFIGSLGITVDDEKTIFISGNEGLYFKASGSGYFCVMKDYIVENRLYQIGILRSDRYPTDYEVSSFIDSFQLTSSEPNDNKELEPMKIK